MQELIISPAKYPNYIPLRGCVVNKYLESQGEKKIKINIRATICTSSASRDI
jgi:hypothetical protein